MNRNSLTSDPNRRNVMFQKFALFFVLTIFSGLAIATNGWQFVNVCDSLYKGRIYTGSTHQQELDSPKPFIKDNLRGLACTQLPYLKNLPLAFDGYGSRFWPFELQFKTDQTIFRFGIFVDKDAFDGILRDAGVSRGK